MDYVILAASAALTVSAVSLMLTARRRKCRVLPDARQLPPEAMRRMAETRKEKGTWA